MGDFKAFLGGEAGNNMKEVLSPKTRRELGAEDDTICLNLSDDSDDYEPAGPGGKECEVKPGNEATNESVATEDAAFKEGKPKMVWGRCWYRRLL